MSSPKYYTRETDGTIREAETLNDVLSAMEDFENRCLIARTMIDDVCLVSTIFVCLDHSSLLYGEGEPVLFETVVFGGPHNLEQVHYSTEEEARIGHDAIVDQLRQVAREG